MIDPSRVRRFSCTACGKCCDRGPEMELSESLLLADRFILSLLFKIHSLPRNGRSESARRWWRTLDTRLGPGPALNAHRRQLEVLAADRHVDRDRDRQLFLTLSAIVEDEEDGRCPALIGNRCAIYDRRPLACRTVPLHYSRPPSTLADYLDRFVATPGYECATSEGPDILSGAEILSKEIQESRDNALRISRCDRDWKALLADLMKDAASARTAGLPTFAEVVANSDNGYASMVPIIVAWKAALHAGLMTRETFADLCRKQIALADAAAQARPERRSALSERMRYCQSALLAGG